MITTCNVCRIDHCDLSFIERLWLNWLFFPLTFLCKIKLLCLNLLKYWNMNVSIVEHYEMWSLGCWYRLFFCCKIFKYCLKPVLCTDGIQCQKRKCFFLKSIIKVHEGPNRMESKNIFLKRRKYLNLYQCFSNIYEIVVGFFIHILVIKRAEYVEMVSYMSFHFYKVLIEAVEGLWQLLMFLSPAKTCLQISGVLTNFSYHRYMIFPDSVIPCQSTWLGENLFYTLKQTH